MKRVSDSITKVVKNLYNQDVDLVLTVPEAKFGDLSTNVAMQLAGKLAKPPRQIAEQIVEALGKSDDFIKIEIAGPGFINLYLSDQVLLSNWTTKAEPIYKDKTVVVEYSDPNAFKALHAGHLYTTLVGNSISNLYAEAGAKVIRLNYGGDVGLHAAKAMYGILKTLGGENPVALDSVDKATRSLWVSQRYIEGNLAYESDEQAKDEIIQLNKRIYSLHEAEDKDSDFSKIYFITRQWSYDGFKQLYEKLGVHPFDEYIAESQVATEGMELVKRGLKEGVFEESDGAIVFKGEQFGLHTRVFINSAGLPTYEAKELGLAEYKWQKYHFDQSLIITANDIIEYMKVLLKAISCFYPEAEERTVHLTHGIIKMSGGVKMSSRTGNALMAQDILDASYKAAKELSEKDDHQVAVGAVKYSFLRQRIGGDIIFEPSESISMIGNSGPYIQYAHARASSILSKSGVEVSTEINSELDEAERSLARSLSLYQLSLNKAVSELTPHHICNYLYELSQSFNRFYEHNKVVGSDRQQVRLGLVKRYGDTLKAGLSILGMSAPDKM